MKTGDEYRKSIRDGRSVIYQGRTVTDIEAEPSLRLAVDAVAAGYDRAFQPGPGVVNPNMRPPRSRDELRQKIPWYMELDMLTDVTYQSLATLLTAAPRLKEFEPDAAERMYRYVETGLTDDIRIAECITDAKGDRSVRPLDQEDPDAYVRVVDRQTDGVVIRGAKLHITGASFAHDLMVIPTKKMGLGEDAYSIACMVPVQSPGVHCVNTGFVGEGDPRDAPTSVQRAMFDAVVIFDDVFVPAERIFLDGRPELAAIFAHTLGLWERLGGLTGLVEQADRLVGFASLIAEANGTSRVSHVREKIDDMAIYATMIRAGLEAAIANAEETVDGYVYPSQLFTNAAKHYGASQFNLMLRHLHDIGGGSIATVPGTSDFEHNEVGELLAKYFTGAVVGEGHRRAQLFRGIRDVTASPFGGWRQVTNTQSGGGLFAQRLVARRAYDFEHARALALSAAGLDPAPDQDQAP
jgi:4-hydroxybutyryl-CoA dehydratase / vinylacetyl-CoA-Delta-isomerase